MKYKRPSWDETFMKVMRVFSERGTCNRGRSAAVITKDKHIVSFGYVGSPKDLPHCDDVGHLIKTVIHEDGTKSRHCMRTVHAEQNAIYNAAYLGRSTKGATIYTKMSPCANCAGAIINSGIERVVCEMKHHLAAEGEKLLRRAGIKVVYFSNEVVKYDKQR